MRRVIAILTFLASAAVVESTQTNVSSLALFNNGASPFIKEQRDEALKKVNEGLIYYPNDYRLLALKKAIEENQKQQKQQQSQPESKPEDQPSDPKEDAQPPTNQPPSPASMPSEEEDDQRDQPQPAERPQDMTREEATRLLDAMKEQEQANREQMARDRMRMNMGQLPPVEKDW